jgi:hypothetical protein
MSQTHQQAQSKHGRLRLFVLGAILLGVFAVYAPALRLMPFYDDIGVLPILRDRSLLNIFIPQPLDENYRPLSYALWLIVRDLLGFFLPVFLHAWNVWLHVLNMALLAALASRLARLFHLDQLLFASLCLLIFGLYPFSYEAVLWAAAVNRILMVTFGLSAILVYLSAQNPKRSGWARAARLLLCGVLLIAACLSHETGYIYGALLFLVELTFAYAEHRRIRVEALALLGMCILYALLYRAFVHTTWSADGLHNLVANLSAWYPNALIHAQGMVAWLVVLIRDMIGLPESGAWIVLVAFVVAMGVVLVGLWYVRRLQLGLLAFAWWVIAMLPSTLWLSEAYMSRGSQLLYEPSIGVAFLWAAALTCLLQVIRLPIFKLMFLGCAGIILAWSVMYIGFQRDEVARLTPALRMIDADLRQSKPSDKVLLVNMPYWGAPTNPAFLLGAQGMQYFQEGRDAVTNWLASVSGVYREAESVRHDISLTHGDRVMYAVFGKPVDDAALRAQLLHSNLIYRFDYDAPGLRVSRLAKIGDDQTHAPPFAKFSIGSTQAALRSAQASLCGDHIALELAWSDVRNMNLPTGVFVHVMDVDNNQAIVADSDLVDGYLPIDQVPAGMVVTETRNIKIPADIAPPKQIELGTYIRAGQARMTAIKSDGSHWDGDAAIVPIGDDLSNPLLCRRIGE